MCIRDRHPFFVLSSLKKRISGKGDEISMEFKDYYQILGLNRKADEKEIKKTYRRLARKYHPDLNPGNKESEKRFKEINEAYEVLGDPEKRKRYDELGSAWNSYGQKDTEQFWKDYYNKYGSGGTSYQQTYSTNFEGGDFSDFFRTFFGDLFGGSISRTHSTRFRSSRKNEWINGYPQKGEAEPSSHPIEIDFIESVLGTRKNFHLEFEEPCPQCRGQKMCIRDRNNILLREGYLRDLVHQIQLLRKEAGFEVEDRIRIGVNDGTNQIARILIQENEQFIQDETLSLIHIS